jgi:hypothetical protein
MHNWWDFARVHRVGEHDSRLRTDAGNSSANSYNESVAPMPSFGKTGERRNIPPE